MNKFKEKFWDWLHDILYEIKKGGAAEKWAFRKWFYWFKINNPLDYLKEYKGD